MGFENNGAIVKGHCVQAAGGKTLGHTHEGDKFVLGCLDCQPGKQHFKYCTLNSIRGKVSKLNCVFCHGIEKGAKVESEMMFIHTVKLMGMDQHIVYQVEVAWKGGLVDFVYIPSAKEPMEGWIHIEVDGSSHTKLSWGVGLQRKVIKDLEQCTAAWAHGAKLMRLHHEDLMCPELLKHMMDTMMLHNGSALVALSPSYSKVKAFGKGTVSVLRSVPDLLHDELGDACELLECDSWDCWFYVTK